MTGYDFESSVGYWLTLAMQSYHRALSRKVARHGITYRQMQVIGWLVHSGGLSQTELARRLMIEPPTLVRILDRMEAAGWIERQTDLQDRRKRVLALTESAAPLWEKIMTESRQVRREAVETIPEAEQQQFMRLLQQVFHNLGEFNET